MAHKEGPIVDGRFVSTVLEAYGSKTWVFGEVGVGIRYLPSSHERSMIPLTVLTKPSYRAKDPDSTMPCVTVADQDGISRKSLADLAFFDYSQDDGKYVHKSGYMTQFKNSRSEAAILADLSIIRNQRAAQAALIAGAAESQDEIGRLSYLTVFAEKLRESSTRLEACYLTMEDIAYIANRSYHVGEEKPARWTPELQFESMNTFIQRTLSLFEGLA
jgi:hypothetical protein